MKKIKIPGIILLVILAGTGTWYYTLRKEKKPVVLNTETPVFGSITNSVTATGKLEPEDTVSVGTQVSGTISNVYADFNAKVKKGQLIAELDKSLLLAQVNQIKANLELARSQVDYQKTVADRQTLLFNEKAISQADYETATYQYKSAQENVKSVKSQLDAAQKNLSYANIYSPVDGVVMVRNVSPGQTVASSFSTPTLFVIAKDISRMQVQAAVDEADIGHVMKNQRASFTVDAFPETTFSGTVQEIRLQPTISANVVTYTTIIRAPNNDQKLKPGMTANITVFIKELDSVLLISARALKFTPGKELEDKYKIAVASADSIPGKKGTHKKKTGASGKYDSGINTKSDTSYNITPKRAFVWVKVGDSIVQRKILTGMTDDTQVQVLKGLSPGDEVIDGIELPAAKSSNGSGGTKSPFIPQRANNNRRQQTPR